MSQYEYIETKQKISEKNVVIGAIISDAVMMEGLCGHK